jgi:hypothetical protein
MHQGFAIGWDWATPDDCSQIADLWLSADKAVKAQLAH